MRNLKYLITYGNVTDVLKNFPEVLAECKEKLKIVKDMAKKEFERPATAFEEEEHWGVIHGDFWAGKEDFS